MEETPNPNPNPNPKARRIVKIKSSETWDSHLRQSKAEGTPIVAHFTASWCIPSVAMNPFIQDLASDLCHIIFLVVDVDDFKEIANKYEVKAMPTFLLMKEGVVVGKVVGANPYEMKKRIETTLQSNTHFVV
ncbi:hypothetical protein QVD17_21349 [Tagetes erecta]|uniref:Thioredoxin domain-containing protein n=1 Tax=Tagetes erecta TaxID=13708 RepID=A0AAD8NT38_TARER|nr:hypothetical protein QVD17_21349 [Tagetes erecta]